MNRSKSVKPVLIDICLSDIITPKSCSAFVTELIKFIVFNKQQIPYPYERLKMYVMKRMEQQKFFEVSNNHKELSTSHGVAFLMEKHYKKVDEAYKILESTFKSIEHELIKSAETSLEEVVLLFGATPISPRDIYRIKIPSLIGGHCESQHMWKKQIANLFNGIILSDEVNANIQKKVGLTNMFVLMKMKRQVSSSQWLLPKDHFRLPSQCQQVCFSFMSSTSRPCSCSNEVELEQLTQNMTEISISDDVASSAEMCDPVWYQTSKTLRGFKDCKSKGKSIADLWYKHRFL